MAIMVIGHDASDAPALRAQHLKAHLAYIESIFDEVCVAGPLKSGDGALAEDVYNGSCFIYKTDNMERARELFANDPYALAGVYEGFTFSQFTPAAGEWIGGTIW